MGNSKRLIDSLEKIATSLAGILDELKKLNKKSDD